MRKLRCRRLYACGRSHSGGGAGTLVCRRLAVLRGAHLHCPTKPAVGRRPAAVVPVPEEESAELSHTQRRSRLPVVLHRPSHECLQRPQKLCLVRSAPQGPTCAQLRSQRCLSRAARAQPSLHLRKGCGRSSPALLGARGSVGENSDPGLGLSLSMTCILPGLPHFPGARFIPGAVERHSDPRPRPLPAPPPGRPPGPAPQWNSLLIGCSVPRPRLRISPAPVGSPPFLVPGPIFSSRLLPKSTHLSGIPSPSDPDTLQASTFSFGPHPQGLFSLPIPLGLGPTSYLRGSANRSVH